MPNLSQITINGVLYDIKDAVARDMIREIAANSNVGNESSGGGTAVTEVYRATYGSTSFSNILSAYNLGKIVKCSCNDMDLTAINATQSLITFSAVVNLSNSIKIYTATCTSNNIWSNNIKTIQESNGGNMGSTTDIGLSVVNGIICVTYEEG